jgi:putative hemolysin
VGLGWQIALVLLLVVINAVLAGSEIALLSLREGQLHRLEQRGSRGRAVADLARDPNRFLATIQIGITLAGFLASATAAVTLAGPLVAVLEGPLGRAAQPVAVVLVTSVLTFVTLVVGELAPKRVALQRPEGWSLAVGRPLTGLAAVARPVVWLLGRATDVAVRLMRGDPQLRQGAVTQEEIRDLIATGGLYTREERRIITGALEATDRVLRQVMRPRPSIVALPGDLDVETAVDRLLEAGHTRAPVYAGELDDADRVASLIDLVGRHGSVAHHAREALVLPESVAVIDALRSLQSARQTMALVVSEYGGLEGIVTVEDLVEELVGEIHDEYDRDVRDVVRHPDGSVTVVGSFPVHDLVDLGIDLPGGEYVTVGGLVQDRLARLAEAGDRMTVGAWELEVRAVHGRAVRAVRIGRAPQAPAAPEGPEPPDTSEERG